MILNLFSLSELSDLLLFLLNFLLLQLPSCLDIKKKGNVCISLENETTENLCSAILSKAKLVFVWFTKKNIDL